MTDVQLSQNFWLSEFQASSVALEKKIDNRPPPEAIANLRWLALNVLQPLRDHLGLPVTIMSGFRNVKLNWLVGGVSGSDHLCRGRRAGCDISVPGKTLEEIGEAIRFLALPVRQVIIEKDQGVVHVSIERPLLEFLIRKLVKGKLVYLTFGESQGRAKAKAFMSRLISRIIQRRGC